MESESSIMLAGPDVVLHNSISQNSANLVKDILEIILQCRNTT